MVCWRKQKFFFFNFVHEHIHISNNIYIWTPTPIILSHCTCGLKIENGYKMVYIEILRGAGGGGLIFSAVNYDKISRNSLKQHSVTESMHKNN